MSQDSLPETLDWRHWVDRYDRMQDRYLIDRGERFDVIVRMVLATQGDSPRILDLGCGTGSLMEAVLAGMPASRAVGIDLDSTLLPLARARLARFGRRADLRLGDLREDGWAVNLGGQFDAAVSATALHWISPEQLAALYRRVAGVLKPGGIFLNADHVASESSGTASRRDAPGPPMRPGRHVGRVLPRLCGRHRRQSRPDGREGGGDVAGRGGGHAACLALRPRARVRVRAARLLLAQRLRRGLWRDPWA